MNNPNERKWVFRENSLDLLRLIAASQVMVLHSFEFTMPEVTGNLFFEILRLFPGVPIFFFISGYLISKSYERTPSLQAYFKNRGLRIFPALIVCVFVNILMIASTGYLSRVGAGFIDVSLLFVAKTTILQFYNPDFMRGFGDGVLNGSLWTICVELQFYIVVPMLYRVFSFKKKGNTHILIMMIVLFMFANRFLYLSAEHYSSSVIWKLYRVSFVPWIYMFLVGMLVQRNFESLSVIFQKLPLIPLILVYCALGLLFSKFGIEYGNGISPFIFLALILIIIRFAYWRPDISHRLLNGNDISYGIYIWHMPLVNQAIYLSESLKISDIAMLLIICILIATASWFLMERHLLKLKSFSILPGKNE